MYLRHLKTAIVEAVKTTFDTEYLEPDFRNLHCSIEYPIDQSEYPGCWVDYDDAQALRVAGVNHQEIDEDFPLQPYTRWVFQGMITFTLVALSSHERDRLYDEFIRVLAFGREQPETSQFRDLIESNDFVAMNIDFDQVHVRGSVAAPGTPWGTDEMIYERTLNVEVRGEFIADRKTGELVPLSKIILLPSIDLTIDEQQDEYYAPIPDPNEGYNQNPWG